MDMMYIKRWLH